MSGVELKKKGVPVIRRADPNPEDVNPTKPVAIARNMGMISLIALS